MVAHAAYWGMDSLKHRRARGASWVWWTALGLWLALALMASVALWHMRRDALAGQARELELLSHALADEVDRGLQDVEQGLDALRTELAEGHLPRAGVTVTQALRTRAELLPLVGSLWLVDSGGNVLAASGPQAAPPASSFVPALEDAPTGRVAISRPFAGPEGGAQQVALALDFKEAGAQRRGWIVAAMPASALLGAFSVAAPTTDARMAVFRADGERLAGNVVAPPLQAESSTRMLSRHGLKMVLERDRDAVLAPWREAAQLVTAGMALLLAVMGASAYLVQRANRRRAEAQQALAVQRSRAGRLEALGTLAGGVAHDFNNVLVAIVGFGEMAHESAPKGSDHERHLGRVLQAASRGRKLVERILAFSRGGARASSVFEVEPIVEEVLALLAASLRHGQTIERVSNASGARLHGDPTQVFEAVMNLCTNALQAMPGGGKLTVNLDRVHTLAPRVLSHSELAAGRYVALCVSDQGSGVSAEVMDHLFEPFFTTRSVEAGTGLGLAVVHGVVTDAGGAIDVQSVPGEGARFTVYLPEYTAG